MKFDAYVHADEPACLALFDSNTPDGIVPGMDEYAMELRLGEGKGDTM